jgi:hypothetical protein
MIIRAPWDGCMPQALRGKMFCVILFDLKALANARINQAVITGHPSSPIYK